MVYPFSQVTYRSIVGIFLKEARGKENIPKKVPFVFCSNHVSFLDDVLLPATIILTTNRYVHMYVNSRFYKSKFLKMLLDHYKCLPVFIEKHNYSRTKNEKTFKTALRLLKKGESIGIFPEGNRSIDGKLKKAKYGAARLALTAKIPILPMGINGSYELWPKGKGFPKLKKKVIINIGKPMYFEELSGKATKKNLKSATNKLMAEIAKLTGQRTNY